MRKVVYSLFFIGSALFAMEQRGLGTSKALFAPKSQYCGSIKEAITTVINSLEQGSLYVDMFILTDEGLVKVLCAAQKRGLDVSVNLDGTRKENNGTGKLLQDSGVAVQFFNQSKTKRKKGKLQNLHCKSICYTGKKEDKIIYGVIAGSYNFSNLASNHKEIVIQTEDDIDFYQQYAKSHNGIKQLCLSGINQSIALSPSTTPTKNGKKIVLTTPRKRKAIDSINYHLLDALKERIDSAKPDAIIDLNFLSFNHQQIRDSLVQAADKNCRIRLFIDGSEAENSRSVLDNLAKCTNIKIYVFNPSKKIMASRNYSALHHRKSLTRLQGNDEALVLVTSANATQSGDDDINHLSFHPHDLDLLQQIRKENDCLQNECIEYTLWRASNNNDQKKSVQEPPTKHRRMMPQQLFNEQAFISFKQRVQDFYNDICVKIADGVDCRRYLNQYTTLQQDYERIFKRNDTQQEVIGLLHKIDSLTQAFK